MVSMVRLALRIMVAMGIRVIFRTVSIMLIGIKYRSRMKYKPVVKARISMTVCSKLSKSTYLNLNLNPSPKVETNRF